MVTTTPPTPQATSPIIKPSVVPKTRQHGIFRYSPWDGVMVFVALLQGLSLFMLIWKDIRLWGMPLAGLWLAILMWWNSNSISHNHIHNPFFRSSALNHLFTSYLSFMLSIPQSHYKEQHLWHHAGEPLPRKPYRWYPQKIVDFAMVLLAWGLVVWWHPDLFLKGYLPGFALGLALGSLQGYYEHKREPAEAPGISYYGTFHNWIWFNDGYHIEHHRYPRAHWTQIKAFRQEFVHYRSSSFPPHFRWLEDVALFFNRIQGIGLTWLERSSFLWKGSQRWMLRTHEQAFAKLLATPEAKALHEADAHILIIGGGLFPRTAIVLKTLLPQAKLTILDANPQHLSQAKAALEQHFGKTHNITCLEAFFDPQDSPDCDALVLPLAFYGQRQQVYRQPPVPLVFCHDWLWSRQGQSAVVSPFLCKGLNLVAQVEPTE